MGYNLSMDVSVQDCSNSSANALELLQSCTEPLVITFLPILFVDATRALHYKPPIRA